MTQTSTSKTFEKQFVKLSVKDRSKALKSIDLFSDQPFAPKLRNHALTGKYTGHRSISAGGDLRLHFIVFSSTSVVFVAIGTYSQLYG
jgi:mRNA-degrading endonuclease YafQ of YafQ-DinJ toxin-antitoxin module